MSQRSRRHRNRANRSQTLNSSDEESFSQTQTQPASQSSIPDEVVQKCVRFFLTKMGTNVPIKRPDIVHAVFQEKPGRQFDAVLKSAREILQKVYGLNVQTIDVKSGSKKFIVTNELAHNDLMDTEDENLKTSIRFLVLTHIFMTKNTATETSLWEFLKVLNILPDKKLNDSDVYTFVMKQLVKEQYIQFEAGGGTNDGEPNKKLLWGSRAEECVSKMEILKFVAKMYGNANIKTWSSRYELAKNQLSFAELENGVEMMIVDD